MVTGHEPIERDPLGNRPAEDELALGVAEAKVRLALFGVQQDVAVGRYKLLELVGRGGLGVVWGAWDPELQRKVAIKLMDARRRGRDRMVDEARSLAKVSHPNVVPIYDVGIIEDRVYLVMEWVVGDTLRNYLHESRTVREVVDLYAQAARALAAVHAAGLVHRDFKPDNAMVGADRRVRVLDFGLALGEIDDAARGEIAGTPRYMAPEQKAGELPTPAVDQYAWCVSLREALDALPSKKRTAWLAAICARGTAEKPADRFASMDELLRALGRDPARLWRRRIVAGALVAATASAFAAGRTRANQQCTDLPDDVVTTNDQARIASHLDQLGGFPAAERAAVIGSLDGHQRALSTAHRTACIAHDRGALTTGLYERRLTCLARARASIATTAEILEHSTAANFPDARIAVSSLADANACALVDESLIAPPPPTLVPMLKTAEAALERARVLTTAARPEAVDTAVQARKTAETTAYLPLIARALLIEGRARMWADDPSAKSTLERAIRSGIAAQDDATTVEAFARLTYEVAIREASVADGATVVDAIAERLPRGTFARLLLLNNLGAAQLATSNDSMTAQPFLEAALRESQSSTADDERVYELVSIRQNLAFAIDDPKRSLDLLIQAHGAVVRTLGADHPKALELEQGQAAFVDLDRARRLMENACERYEHLFLTLAEKLANCRYDAGWLADEAGDHARAAKLFAGVRFDARVEPIRLRIAAAMAAINAHPTDLASLAQSLEAVGTSESAGRLSWNATNAADAFMAAARAWQVVGDRASERRSWNLANRILQRLSRGSLQSERARVHSALALLTEGDVAKRFATEALSWYRAVGAPSSVIHSLERILKK